MSKEVKDIFDDLDAIRIAIPINLYTEEKREKSRKVKTSLPQPIKGEAFLKGPIPFSWITTAESLGKHVLFVGLCLWYIAGCEKTAQIRITQGRVAKYCKVSRHVVGRAFRKLHKAGLIATKQNVGAGSTITLLSTLGNPKSEAPDERPEA
jgi:hypothetical protein